MSQRKILLVEDDIDVADLTRSLLESRKFLVEVAHSGSAALQKAGANPDLILLDVTLPDMEGYDVCRRLRENDHLRAIPIIMVSARDALADRIEGLYAGADDYITKPFDTVELFARIEAVLRRAQVLNKNEEGNNH
jgi:two-component system, OmpR family, alkaline phosphatase synthesis response regulator PhoP